LPNNLNLAPSEEFENVSTWEKVYLWGANFGKIIIIITNFIIISVWLYRWQLDRQIYNLTIEIENKQLAITSISKTEEKIRKIQSKLNAVRKIETEKTYYSTLIKSINKSTIKNIEINRITFAEENSINIDAIALNGNTFATYINNLLTNDEVKEVILYSSTLNGTTGEYSFIIEVTTNEQ